MKAVLLVRVSTQGQDYSSQEQELRQHANKLGYNELHVIADKESAIKLSEEERHGLNEMKQYLTDNTDCKDVFVWELSRLARNEKVLHSIKEWLITRQINLHIATENITLLDSEGKESYAGGLLFSLFGHLATQEMKDKQARLTRGKRAAAANGKYIGGPIKLGYQVDNNGYIVVNDNDSRIVQFIFDNYASGQYSLRSLSNELKERGYNFTNVKLQEILSDKAYIGQSKSIHSYPSIIDNDLFHRCQEVKKLNKTDKSKASKHLNYLANKKIKCLKCGHYYVADNMTYSCVMRKYHRNFRVGEQCTANPINVNIIHTIFAYVAKECHLPYLMSLSQRKAAEIQEEKELVLAKLQVAMDDNKRIEEKNERLMMLYVDGKINKAIFDKKTAEIESEKTNIATKIKGFNSKLQDLNNLLELSNRPTLRDNALLTDAIIELLQDDNVERLKQYTDHYIKVAHVAQCNSFKLIYVVDYNNEVHQFLYDSRSGKDKGVNLVEFEGNFDSITIVDWRDGDGKKLTKKIAATLSLPSQLRLLINKHLATLQLIKEVDNL